MKTFLVERALGMLLVVIVVATTDFAQSSVALSQDKLPTLVKKESLAAARPLVVSVLANYYSQADGVTLNEIVKRAFDTNGEIKIARLDVEKAQARLIQAGQRANPTIDVESSSGRLVGSPGDRELRVGASMTLDLYGQRSRRMEVARADITLKEAELSARQRSITNQIFATYIEALESLREIKILEELLEIDAQTARFVQIRVNEGETPPLELNLLQAEVDRLRAQHQMAEGKLQSALTRLKFFAGIPFEESMKLREEVGTASLPLLPPTTETGISIGIRNRPEVRLAELEEDLANAGLRLIRSQSKPEVTAFTGYTSGRSTLEDPRGVFSQNERSLTFGVSISLPVFNKNQGAKAEAEITIRQAQERRIFIEQVVRSEILAAFQRLQAAERAVNTLETAVLPRSRENIETIRRVYEIGELKITDLLAEQRRLLDASRDLSGTLTERYRSKAELFIALGITLD